MSALAVLALLIGTIVGTSATIAPQPAQAAPGTPGTPQPGTMLFSEDFENVAGTAPVNLTDYTGAGGQQYTADPGWLTGCNGQIVNFTIPSTLLGNCAEEAWSARTRQLAWALGAHAGSPIPANNDAVTAFTGNDPGANAIEFQTVSNIPLPAANGRYLTFSVDTAAINCWASAPLYQFSLVDSVGGVTAVGGLINACTSPTTVTAPASGSGPAADINVGTYTSNGSILFSGPSVGIRMTNANGSGIGNDAAFDNVQILDVTPQLDKAFSPTSMYQGQSSTLTFTVTNTSELASKNGWSFTDALPAGLTVASPSNATTTCPAGVLSAPAGATSISLQGNLSAGMASCTATVSVTTNETGTYTNGPDNITSTGLNPPGTSTLTVTTSPVFDCDAFGYLFQSPNQSAAPHQIVRVDLATGESTLYGQTPTFVNAVGFNELDGYFYGTQSPGGEIVRIAADGSLTVIAPATWTVIGDIDPDGFYWTLYGETWRQYDLRPGSVTYGALLDTGTTQSPGTFFHSGSDWTYINGSLYRIGISGGVASLISFDTVTKQTVNLGAIGGLPATYTTQGFGATYSDANGYLYGSYNTTGEIVRVDIASVTGIVASDGPPSTGNDGARCGSAPIPTLTVEKVVVDRLTPTDQFIVGIIDDGDTLASAATTGSGTTASTIDWPVSQGKTYTITDAMAAGSTNPIGEYDAAIGCTDGSGAPVAVSALDGGGWALAVADATDYTCVVTNTGAYDPALSIVKSATPNSAAAFVVGQQVEYAFVVTNTGNTTLTDLVINDDVFSGTGALGALDCTPAATTLEPGAQLICTADYVLTQADIDSGSVTNSATATGTPPEGPPVESPPSDVTIPVLPSPAVSLEKSVAPASGALTAGDQVTYSFLVTNEGNVTLTNLVITEGAFSGAGTLSGITCPATPLIPGAQTACTATYALTQEDVDAGIVTNDATAMGTTPDSGTVTSGPSSAELVIVSQPAITVVKSATPANGALEPGDTVTYFFLVTNTGNVTLTDISVTETQFTGTGEISAITCPDTSLAPGIATTCTATYELTAADVDGGGVSNTATVTGTPPSGAPPVSPPSEVTIEITPEPGISIVKSASPNSGALVAGDQIAYSFLVTNTGNVTLTNVTVDDSDFSGTGTLPAVTCPAGAASLAVGESVTCETTYTLTQADVDVGAVTNSATATGTPPSGAPPVSPPSGAIVEVDPEPGITIVKSATPSSVEDFVLGQEITYSFVITNTGNVTLDDVEVDESDFSGSGTLSPAVCPVTTLQPNEQVTCTSTYTLTQVDIDAGLVSNSATATGTPPGGGTPPVSPPSEFEIPTPQNPGIAIVKSATPVSGALAVGDEVTYTFFVTNTGNVTLTDVAVDETAFTGTGTLPSATCPAGAASLAPGASVACTAIYELTQLDVDSGQVTNTATAAGTPPSGPPPVSPPSTAIIDIDPAPALELVKSVAPTAVSAAGQQVTYSFLVTNTGNVTVLGVSVTEWAFSGTGDSPTIDCPVEADSLAPTATVTCTGTYTATQADIDAGVVSNTAVAGGVTPADAVVDSNPSTAVFTADANTGISIVKSASPLDADSYTVGQVITYSFVVTNTGNVTLADVTVNEGAFSGTGELSPIDCPATALAPGAQTTCTATYVLTQADVDAGELANSATATGTPPSGPPPESPPSEFEIPTPPLPDITVVKSATPNSGVLASGDEIAYSFLVTNTGNVTLTDVTVDDTDFTGTGTLAPVVCPAEAASLAPGASVTCTTTYELTQADVDSGEVSNSATATGTPPSGPPPESPPSDVTIDIDPESGIAIVKSVTPTTASQIGDAITYSFLVTNTGNVTLTDVVITEQDFSGTGELSAITCPAGASSLAPGVSVTCLATYVLTQADIDAGEVTNIATATATPPAGPPPVSPPSETTIELPPSPNLAIVKSASPSSLVEFVAGQVITYSFVVTNTGNVTLTDVTVDDTELFTGTGLLSPVVCPAGAAALAPGAQVICSATYTLTQDDIDAGSVTNAATSTGTPPSGPPPVSPPSEISIPTPPLPALEIVKSSNADALAQVGQEIEYSFLVTNTGNVTLTDVAVDEADFSGSEDLSVVTCPAEASAMIPGQSIVCSAIYTVTQVDLDSGELSNIAAASGQGPGGGARTESEESDVDIPFTGEAALQLAKSASLSDVDGNGVNNPGDRVTWTFVVTNIGIVTISDIVVTDPTAGEVTCAATVLPPGAQMECEAIQHRVVRTADIAVGVIVNIATAAGTGPGETTVTSNEAEARVSVVATPSGLAFTGATGVGLLAMLSVLLLTVGLLIVTQRRRLVRR